MLTTQYFRWSSISTILSGLLLFLSLLIHPADSVENVSTRMWVLSHSLSTLGFLLLLFGLVGAHFAQKDEAGWLGGLGFVLALTSTALNFALSYYEALISPVEAAMNPQFTQALFSRQLPESVIGVIELTFVLTIVGWAVMGFAVTRARVLSRGAAWTTFLGAVLILGDEILLPFGHWPGALFGLGIVWLGLRLLKGKN